MSRARLRSLLFQFSCAIVAGSVLGGFLGFASAQETAAGWLDIDCAGRCTANGYDAAFCGQVCWVPDPIASAKADNLDWKCFEGCRARGNRAEPCLASCRRY